MPVNSERAALFFPVTGNDASKYPTGLNSGYQWGVNTRICQGLLAPRPGIKEIPLSGASDEFLTGNFQGALDVNPAKGLSALQFARDKSAIATAIGGKKFMVDVRHNEAVVTDITSGFDSDANLRLVYWVQGENYVIAQDGKAPAFIYDGSAEIATQSVGYSINKPDDSRVPNAATVGVYAHGRLAFVVDKRWIPVGDIVHNNSLTKAENILEFIEQGYWAEGNVFAPPSMMSDIVAAAPLPLKNTQHGHRGVLFHTRNGGIFSINWNVYPRTDWGSTQMVGIVQLDSAAQGPYALDTYYGDHFYRSRKSVDSIRSAAADDQAIGNPDYALGEKITELLEIDYEPFLEYASLNIWRTRRRMLVTIQPETRGKWRDHRGIVSATFKPVPGERNTMHAWEGIWTLPPWTSRVSQLVNGIFQNRFRQFAWTWDLEEGRNRLVEFDESLKYDYRADGTKERISWQVVTPAFTWGSPLERKEFDRGYLHLRDVSTDLDWQVFYKTDADTNWKLWREGCIEAGPFCDEECPRNQLRAVATRNEVVPLGKLINVKGYDIQLLVKLRGWAKIYSISVEASSGEQSDPEYGSACKEHTEQRMECEFRMFEYSERLEGDEWYERN